MVSIDPTALSLRSATFDAYLTLPKGFEALDWGIRDVTCQGAHAIGAWFVESIHSPVYLATFRTQDLVGVTPGNAVTFTVSFTLHSEEKQALSQATTTIQVTP